MIMSADGSGAIAGWRARQRLRSVAIEARPALRGGAQIDHEACRQEVTVCAGGTPVRAGRGAALPVQSMAARRGGQDVRDMLARVIGAIEL
jgi:hypothetical protein